MYDSITFFKWYICQYQKRRRNWDWYHFKAEVVSFQTVPLLLHNSCWIPRNIRFEKSDTIHYLGSKTLNMIDFCAWSQVQVISWISWILPSMKSEKVTQLWAVELFNRAPLQTRTFPREWTFSTITRPRRTPCMWSMNLQVKNQTSSTDIWILYINKSKKFYQKMLHNKTNWC